MKENNFFNFQRALTAMLLRDKLREDGLGIYEQQVLNFLGSKMANKTIPNSLTVVNSCFYTVNEIAKGSFAKATRTSEALNALIEKGYLTKDDFKIAGRDRIRYTLVEAVWDAAWDKQAGKTEISRIAAPLSAADQAVLDALETKPAQKHYKANKKVDQNTSELLVMLKEHFPHHPSLTCPTADRIAAACSNRCLVEADGDATAYRLTLNAAFSNQEIKAKASSTYKLCGWITKQFPEWHASWKTDGVVALAESEGARIRRLLGNSSAQPSTGLIAVGSNEGALAPPPEEYVQEEVDDVVYYDEASDDIEVQAEEFWTREPEMQEPV